jgi:hypothetical protein
MYIKLFEEFEKTQETKNKPKKKKRGETDSYPPPEYLVQPAKGDKGFFMFKKAFDSMKKKFDVGFFSV